MTYVPPPRNLIAFPEAKRVKPKTPLKGRGYRKRWMDAKFIYEWDSLHGKVERYNKRGNHLGEFDPVTGEQTKEADPNKSVEP